MEKENFEYFLKDCKKEIEKLKKVKQDAEQIIASVNEAIEDKNLFEFAYNVEDKKSVFIRNNIEFIILFFNRDYIYKGFNGFEDLTIPEDLVSEDVAVCSSFSVNGCEYRVTESVVAEHGDYRYKRRYSLTRLGDLIIEYIKMNMYDVFIEELKKDYMDNSLGEEDDFEYVVEQYFKKPEVK